MVSVHVTRDEGGAARTCLRPTRAELRFQNLGMISGVIAANGVENLGGRKDLYMQGRRAPSQSCMVVSPTTATAGRSLAWAQPLAPRLNG